MNTTYISITVPANGQFAINTPGRVFACDSATADFAVRFDNQSEFTCSSKRVLGSSTSPEFKRITVRNLSGSNNTIVYAVSFQDIKIEQQISSIIATITVAASKNAATYTKGTTATLGGGGATFSGSDGGNVRKSFSIWNNEAAGSGNNILVLGENGIAGHVVAPQSSYVVESGDQIEITGSGFQYYAMEVFYS